MLAIVIPYYNLFFFEETLKSLANQTEKKFTVYIGDDNSPENPNQLIKKYRDHLNIKYKKFPHHIGPVSLYSHWKRCLTLVRTENWFVILGDDDRVDENFVFSFYKYLEEVENNRFSVIKYASQLINENNVPISKVYTTNKIENSVNLYFKKISNQFRSSLSEHIFKVSAYKKYGIYKSIVAWHSDDMMILQFSDFKNLFCINDSVVQIRLSSKSLSGNPNRLHREKHMATIFFYLDLLLKYRKHFNIHQSETLFFKLLQRGTGIGIEVGYAKAKGKTIIYLRRVGAEHSTTVSGISDFRIVYLDADDLRRKLYAALSKWENRFNKHIK